jgi:ubiquinone/menaquinone biosynthesis C-methylase UbiE
MVDDVLLVWEEINMTDQNQAVKDKTRFTYDSASDHFDDAPLAFWDRYGRGTVERLKLKPGSSVLDVGCGTGASAIPAAQTVAPDGHVIGVDLAEKMLAVARDKAAKQGLHNVEFRVGDMENLGFPDGHFDAVISVFSIFFVPDMEKQTRELWRMVRPGGQLAITTWGTEVLEPMNGRWLEALQNVRPDLAQIPRPWERLTTTTAVEQLLLDSGIPHADVVSEEGSQPLRAPEDWWTIILGYGTRWTVEQLAPHHADQVRTANLKWAADNHITSVQTNVIYATVTKPIAG